MASSFNYGTIYDASTMTWHGPEAEAANNFNCSIGSVIFEQMKSAPQKIFQIDDVSARFVTNEEALSWAICIATHLQRLGLNEQHVVAIIGKNSHYSMAAALACLLNATPFHAINPVYDEKIFTHLLAITKPSIIFCDAAIQAIICSSSKGWKPSIYTLDTKLNDVLYVEELLWAKQSLSDYTPRPLVDGADQTMGILCSSGTTGMPKAVCISNRKLFTYFPANTGDVVYSNSGIDWISGLVFFLLSASKGCTRVISSKPFTSEYLVELVEKYKINIFWGAPGHVTALQACKNVSPEKLNSLRLFVSGGGFVAQNALVELKRVFQNAHIMQAYGLTELGIITLNFDKDKLSAVGSLERGMCARILDAKCRKMGPNEVGSLCVQSVCKWRGYYNNRKATLEMQNEDGWCRTGDICYFDDKGLLYVVDREKETLKYAGLHYWPTEIENIIAEMPGVLEVCVVGVYDEKIGDVAGALVKKLSTNPLSEQKIQAYVAQRLPPFKQLHAGVIFTAQLPHNANGKIVRKMAKELFLQLQLSK